MVINKKNFESEAIKLFIEQAGKEVAHAYLYIIKNDLHPSPYGMMEDVFVDENLRGQGIGTELVNKLIETAREKGCSKLIATSRHTRPKVHELYEKIGFSNWGIEFRIDF